MAGRKLRFGARYRAQTRIWAASPIWRTLMRDLQNGDAKKVYADLLSRKRATGHTALLGPLD